MIYRRRKKSDCWHFCEDCHQWPKANYVEREELTTPTTGELCDECLAKRRKHLKEAKWQS